MAKVKIVKLHPVSTKPPSHFDQLMKRLEEPEVKEKLKNWRDITITNIEHIRVCPAANADELAIEIASTDGKKLHLLVKGHYA